MIIYGLVSETSIPRLFLAGVIPGIIVTSLLMLTTFIIAWRRNYRLTSLPASRLGVGNRGRIETGAHADTKVFDAETIASHCDVTDPRRYATGIAHVLVNGDIAFQNGRRTDVDSGTVLRRH